MQSCRCGDKGVPALVPRPGKDATGLERCALRQGLVATLSWGRKVITLVLSATYDLRLHMGEKKQEKKPETELTVPGRPWAQAGKSRCSVLYVSSPNVDTV